MKAQTQFFNLINHGKAFLLESGEEITDIKVAYQTYGKLNNVGDNAILICHALTGNAHAAGLLEEIESD